MTVLTLPQGFRVRPPTLEDAKDVTKLIRTCQIAERGFSTLSEEDLLSNWRLPGVDLAKDVWMIFAPNGQLAAEMMLNQITLPKLHATPWVHPDYVQRGLDAYLLEQAEKRIQQIIPSIREDARVTLNTYCAEKNQVFHQTIEQAGFAYVRSAWVMESEMNEPPPAPVWPEGIELRPFTMDMAHAVYAADDEAFSDHWGYMPISFEIFESLFLHRSDFDPTLWFIACDNEQIVGEALCEYRGEQGWVNGLSTRRPWRHKGVGLALLHHAFGEFYRRGTRKVSLDVDAESLTGATRLYEKAGMHVIHQENQYQKELRPGVELSTQTLEV
ncbi:MAG: GNAT family N-acetyltransferase [Ktedonobacteraceae bacterium]